MGCGTLAALGLTLTGTGAQFAGQQKERSAANAAVGAELGRQQGFLNRAQPVFQQSLAQSTPSAAQQQIGQGQQQALQDINRVQAIPLSASMPSFGNVNTANQVARQGLANKAYSEFKGYSNYPLQQYIKDLSAGSQLGLIGSEAQASEGVLPYELQQAAQSQQGLEALGSLLQMGGMLTGLSGLLKAPTALGNGALTPEGFNPYWADPSLNIFNSPIATTTF